MPDSKLTSKGQTTIPKAIREYLKLKTGDRIDFVVGPDGAVVMRPATTDVSELAGVLYQEGQEVVTLKQMDRAIGEAIGESRRHSG